MSTGLTALTLPELQLLVRLLEDGRIGAPITAVDLQARGIGHLVGQLGALDGLADTGSVVAALRMVVAERERRQSQLELVWTGPESRGSLARDTAVVVRQMFARAKREVIVAGYSFDHGEDIFKPLHLAMAERSVSVSIFLDVPRGDGPSDVLVAGAVQAFLEENWPFGEPWPSVYYDPRTVEPGSVASLHAKCIVVDTCHALVTSANFTDRGHTRNIEVGVLIDDGPFASDLAAQWMGLVSSGLVKRAWPRPPG